MDRLDTDTSPSFLAHRLESYSSSSPHQSRQNHPSHCNTPNGVMIPCKADGLLHFWLDDWCRKLTVWHATLPLMDCTVSARCDPMFMPGYPEGSEPHLKAKWSLKMKKKVSTILLYNINASSVAVFLSHKNAWVESWENTLEESDCQKTVKKSYPLCLLFLCTFLICKIPTYFKERPSSQARSWK